MKRFFSQKTLLLSLCLTGVTAALATPAFISHGASRSAVGKAAPAAVTPTPQPAARQSASGQFLVIYAAGYGFEPESATVKEGPLALFVRDRTSLPPISYELTTKEGAEVRASAKAGGNRSLALRNTFAAGEYKLTDPRFPDRVFTLKVVK